MAAGKPKPKIIVWKPGITLRQPQVYLDANFLIGLAWPEHMWHASAKALQAHCAEQRLKLVIASLGLSEAIYQLKSFEQKTQATTPNSPKDAPASLPDFDDNALADEPDLRQYRLKTVPTKATSPVKPPVRWATLLEQTLRGLPNLEFFEPPDITFHLQVIQAVQNFKLDPTDAFHYVVAARLACPIVTNDTGFQRLPDPHLTVVTFF